MVQGLGCRVEGSAKDINDVGFRAGGFRIQV